MKQVIKRLHLGIDFLIFKDLRTHFSLTLDGTLSLTLQPPHEYVIEDLELEYFHTLHNFFLFTDDNVSQM